MEDEKLLQSADILERITKIETKLEYLEKTLTRQNHEPLVPQQNLFLSKISQEKNGGVRDPMINKIECVDMGVTPQWRVIYP
jgi:hypothetical protein